MRWTEVNAFTAVLRTHMGSDPDANAQVWTDAGATAHFARFARIFAWLAPYRATLMDEAEARGWPVVRPLLMHFPEDAKTHGLATQFMLGSELVLAPVLAPPRRSAARERSVRASAYLPAGDWTRLWQEEDEGFSSAVGKTYGDLSVPYGEPLVFYRRGSAVGRGLSAFVRALPPLERFGSEA
jgi:alpha-glucosidase